jgi:hypothetical protein
MSLNEELKCVTNSHQWKSIVRHDRKIASTLHRGWKNILIVIFASLVAISCGGSGSSPVVDSTESSSVDVTNSTSAPDTTNATMTTLALEEFATSFYAEAHINFLRGLMSANLSNDIADMDIISAAQNVCNQMRTRGLDAWVREVDSKKATDSVQDWRIRVGSTLGASNFFCYEFKNEMTSNPIASGW